MFKHFHQSKGNTYSNDSTFIIVKLRSNIISLEICVCNQFPGHKSHQKAVS